MKIEGTKEMNMISVSYLCYCILCSVNG